MITGETARLAQYGEQIPGAARLARLLADPAFSPEDAAAHGGFTIRHKAYQTKPEEERQFEVHDRTVDLMLCLHGEENIDICDASLLTPGMPLPGGADGRKLIGKPSCPARTLRAGWFVAIFPGEAHRVGGHVNGRPGRVDKLVVKLPIEETKE